MRLKNLKKFTSSRQGLTAVLLAVFTLNQTVPVHASLFPTALPPAFFLSNIQIPDTLGRVEEVYQGKTDELVVYIQDAHANYSAQQSIASLIDMFVRDHDFSVVGQEAAEGRIDTALLRAFPEAKTRREVMDRYLRRGEIGGAEYLAVAGEYTFDFVGVDKRKLYRKNLSEFFVLLDSQKSGVAAIKTVRTVMRNLEDTVYSKRHREFRELLAKHRSEQLDFKTFLDQLRNYAEVLDEDISKYKQLSKLFATDKPSVEDLDIFRLPHEIDELTFSLRARLAETPLEKELISLDEYLSLLKAGFKIELSRGDFLRLSELHALFASGRAVAFLKENSERLRLAPIRVGLVQSEIENLFSKILDFYRTAAERDEAFVKQIRKEMHLRNQKNSVLVTGGFHKDGITKKLRQKGVSYIVITPHIAEPDSRDNYIRLMEKNRSLVTLPERNTLGLPSPLGTPEYRSQFQRRALVEMGVDNPSLLRQQGIYLFGGAAFSSGDLLTGAKRWNNRRQAGEDVDLVDAVRSTATKLPEKDFGFGAKADGKPGQRIDLFAEATQTRKPANKAAAAASAQPAPLTKQERMAEPPPWKKVVEALSRGFFKPATSHRKDMLATFAALDDQREGVKPSGTAAGVSSAVSAGSAEQGAIDDYIDARAKAIDELATLLKERTMQTGGGTTKTVEQDVRWSMLHENWFFIAIHKILAPEGREKIFGMLDVQPEDLVYIIEYSGKVAVSAKIIHVSELDNPQAKPIVSQRLNETVPEGGIIQARKYLILPKTEEVQSLTALTKLFPSLGSLARSGPDIVATFTPKTTPKKVDPGPKAGFGSERGYFAGKILMAAGAVAVVYLTVQTIVREQLLLRYDRAVTELFKLSIAVRRELGLEISWTDRLFAGPIGPVHDVPAIFPEAGLEARHEEYSKVARLHARFVVRLERARQRLEKRQILNVASLWHGFRALAANQESLESRYVKLLEQFGAAEEFSASGFGAVRKFPEKEPRPTDVKEHRGWASRKKKWDNAEIARVKAAEKKAKNDIRKEIKKNSELKFSGWKEWLWLLLTLGYYYKYKLDGLIESKYRALKAKAAQAQKGSTEVVQFHLRKPGPASRSAPVPKPNPTPQPKPTPNPASSSEPGNTKEDYLKAKVAHKHALVKLMKEGKLEVPGSDTQAMEDINDRWKWMYENSLFLKLHRLPAEQQKLIYSLLNVTASDLIVTLQKKEETVLYEVLKTVGSKQQNKPSQALVWGGVEQKGQTEGVDTKRYLVLPLNGTVDLKHFVQLFPEFKEFVRRAADILPASHPSPEFAATRQSDIGMAGFGAKALRPATDEQGTDDVSDLWLFINGELEFAGRIKGKPYSWENFLVKTWMAPGLRAQRTRAGKGVLIDENNDRLDPAQIAGASIEISGTTSAGRPVERTWTISDQKPLTDKEWLSAIRPLNLSTIDRISIELPDSVSGFGVMHEEANHAANEAEIEIKNVGNYWTGLLVYPGSEQRLLPLFMTPTKGSLIQIGIEPDEGRRMIRDWDELQVVLQNGLAMAAHLNSEGQQHSSLEILHTLIKKLEQALSQEERRKLIEAFKRSHRLAVSVVKHLTAGQLRIEENINQTEMIFFFAGLLQAAKKTINEKFGERVVIIAEDIPEFSLHTEDGQEFEVVSVWEYFRKAYNVELSSATSGFGNEATPTERRILAIDARIDRLRAAITEAEQRAESLHSDIRLETQALGKATSESARREITATLHSLNRRATVVNDRVVSVRQTNEAEINRLLEERRRLDDESAAGFGVASVSKINPDRETAQRQVVSAVKEVVRNAALEAAMPIAGFKTIVFSSEDDLARFEKAVLKYSPAVRSQVLGTFNDIAAGWDMADDQKNKIWLRLSELFSSRGQRIYVGANDGKVYSGIRGGVEAVLLGQKTEYLLQKVQDQFILEMMSQNGDRFIDVVLEALYLKQLAENLISVAA